jgi:O-antigen/teichoic acid export membrane protein
VKISNKRFLAIARTLGSFSAIQILSQVSQIAVALLVVRSLRKEEYAWYTMVIALQSAAVTFAASGMGPAMMAMGGPVAHDPRALGKVITSSLQLRWILLVVVIAIAFPGYAYLFNRNGCPPIIAAGLLAAGGVMLFQAILNQLLSFPLILNRQYNVPQVASLLVNLGRAIVILGLIYMTWVDPVRYLIAGLLVTFAVHMCYLLPASRVYADLGISHDPQLFPRYQRFALNGIFPSLSTIFQAQIGIFLISVFGNVSSVADLGALMRLGLLTFIPLGVIQSILVPRLARAKHIKSAMLLWLIAVSMSAILGCLFVLFVYLLRDQVVLLFGPEYAQLRSVVTLYAVSQGIIIFAATCECILNARGWLRHYWLRPFVVLTAQIAILPWLNLSTLHGVILLSIAGGIGYQLFNLFLIVQGAQGKGDL